LFCSKIFPQNDGHHLQYLTNENKDDAQIYLLIYISTTYILLLQNIFYKHKSYSQSYPHNVDNSTVLPIALIDTHIFSTI